MYQKPYSNVNFAYKNHVHCGCIYIDTRSADKNHLDIQVIVRSKADVARVTTQVDLPKIDECKVEILDKFNSINTLVNFPKIIDMT